MRKKTILLGPFGYGNLGDAAIQEAVIQNLRRRCPEIELYGVSLNPTDTEKRHRISSYPLDRRSKRTAETTTQMSASSVTSRGYLLEWGEAQIKKIPLFYWLLKTIKELLGQIGRKERIFFAEIIHWVGAYRFLRGKDLLIISGGGQLDEYWGGAWQQPYALLKWCVLARFHGLKVAFLSTGVGSIESSLTRLFLWGALKLAHYRSFRDKGSLELVQKRLGVRSGNGVVPDMAYSLNWTASPPTYAQGGQRFAVGIGPLSYFDPRDYAWPEHSSEVYDSYIERLARFALWLWQEGHAIVFFVGDEHHDRPVIKDIRKAMSCMGCGSTESRLIEEPTYNVEDLLNQLTYVDVAIASRFHGVLLSHLLCKPVLAISYERKVVQLMRDMGHEQYSANIDTFDVADLQTRFYRLVHDRRKICRDIDARIAEHQEQIERQYDEVLSL